MKKAITFWLGILIFSSISAQDYEPMAIEGAHWVIFSKDSDTTYHHAFTIKGDSMINGTDYKKVYRQEIQSDAIFIQDFLPPYLVGDEYLIGFIRDDMDAERVYAILLESYFLCDAGADELLYDFSLESGDTLPGCLHDPSNIYAAVIDSIGSELLWGKTRETQYVPEGFRFIEGIGGDEGLFSGNSYLVLGASIVLIDYCIGNEMACGLLPVGTHEVANTRFKIYPNPANDYLKIEPSPDCYGTLLISLNDARGSLLLEKEFDCQGSLIRSLPLNGIASGIYFLTIRTDRYLSSFKIQVD